MERGAQGIISILGFEPKLESRLVDFDALAAGLQELWLQIVSIILKLLSRD